jgi:mono/diheme cytochrome c family protein
VRVLAAASTLAAAALLAAGCGTGGITKGKADTARGKQLFVEKCGSCHTLADAGTQGKIGPNLDDAFRGPRQEGFKASTVRNVVHDQIKYAIEHPAGFVKGPGGPGGRGLPAPGMPQNLVTGDDAEDVAAYVASVAGISAAAGATTTTSPSPAPAPPPTTTTTTTATSTNTATTTTGGGSNALAKGKAVFEKAGCASCHTLKDAGATGTVGPNLDEKKPSKELAVERVTNGKPPMPSFKGQLTPAEIDAVAMYVSTVAGK